MKVHKAGMALTLLSALVMPLSASAQPATKMATCKDGTSSKAGRGACSGHGGVAPAAATSKAAPATTPAKTESAPAKMTPAPTKTESAPSKKAAADAKKGSMSQAATITAAPGGGGGKVWVNTQSKVFHREGDEWYGKTKQGKYMTEDEALKAGYRAEKGNKSKKP